MEQVILGEFEKRLTRGRQYVLKFTNWHYFLLKQGLYYKAGRVHNWSGDPEGIGLNPHIVNDVPLENLVIENNATKKKYVFDDLEKAKNRSGQEVQKGKKLVVFPLYTFKQVEIKDEEKIPKAKLYEKI